MILAAAIALALQGGSYLRPELLGPYRQAVVAWAACQKRHIDTAPGRERRERPEALADAALVACAAEEAAMRAIVRRQYNQASVDGLMVEVRRHARTDMIAYIRRRR